MEANTKNRLYEIAFQVITNRLIDSLGREKVNYFLEHFCYAANVDYTSISILMNMYSQKMKPTKRELALYAKFLKVPFNTIPVDYRTLRKYREQWEMEGRPALQPRIVNAFLQPTIQKFVDAYINLMFNEIHYVANLTNNTMEEGKE